MSASGEPRGPFGFATIRAANSPSSRIFSNWATVALPSHLKATVPETGSTTKSVGQASTGMRSRKSALLACSVSMLSQTNRPACFVSPASA